MSFLVNVKQIKQGWFVHGVQKCASLTECQFMRNDLGTSESRKKCPTYAGHTIKQSKNSVLTYEIMYAMF
jgi:hypothetical protein